jgi:hypothetical protein
VEWISVFGIVVLRYFRHRTIRRLYCVSPLAGGLRTDGHRRPSTTTAMLR